MVSFALLFLVIFVYINGYLSGFVENFSPSLFLLLLVLFAGSFRGATRREILLRIFYMLLVIWRFQPIFWKESLCRENFVGRVVARGSSVSLLEDSEGVGYLVPGSSLFPGTLIVYGRVRKVRGIYGGRPYRCRLRLERFRYLKEEDDTLESWKLRNLLLMGRVAGSFTNGVLLGDRREIPDFVRNVFSRLGLSHILAISGLHIGFTYLIVYLLLVLVLREIPPMLYSGKIIPVASLGGMIAAVFYYIISGLQTSARRAVIVLGIYVLSVLLRRKVSSLYIFQLAALVILLLNPWELFSLSFQLSFLAYGIIIVSIRWLPSRWMQIFVPLVMLPVTSFLFGVFPLFSPLVNLIFIPVFGLVVFPVMVLDQIVSIWDERVLIFGGVLLGRLLDILVKLDGLLPHFYLYTPFNFIVALLVPFAYGIFRFRGVRILLLVLFLQQLLLGVVAVVNDHYVMVDSEDSLDVYLHRFPLTERCRNGILRRVGRYPVEVYANGGEMIVRRGIFCRSFASGGRQCHAEGRCQLGDVLIGLFESVAENFGYIPDHVISQ